jgi:hypothetical protein
MSLYNEHIRSNGSYQMPTSNGRMSNGYMNPYPISTPTPISTHNSKHITKILLYGGIFIVCGMIAYGGYQYYKNTNKKRVTFNL